MGKSILHKVLKLGVDSNASDWHIKVDSPITLRIDGELVPTDFIADKDYIHQSINDLLQTEDQKDTLNLTGDTDISYVEDDIGRFRINIHKQKAEYSLSLRYVKTEIGTITDLNLPPILKTLAESQRGIILLTGTTGSGKSTTLAAMLQHINTTFRKHIITIEDPIEYEFFDDKSFFEQREIGLDTVSFKSALKHSLRQDGDVIMVGEMRDRESFDAALQAADTGHLIISTVHSADAPQTISRILNFYKQNEHDTIREALELSLRSIISQRLIPKVLGGGVVPAMEVLINSPVIRKLIRENRLDKLGIVISNEHEAGMQTFNQSLLSLVNEGLISEEDAYKSSSNPEALKMLFQGINVNTNLDEM